MVDLVEDEVEMCWDVWEFGLDEVDENVDGVGINSSTFISASMEDGGADVAREGVWLGCRWFGRVILCGDGLGV